MNVVKILKVGADLFIRFAKRHPKKVAMLAGAAIGGTVGAKVKKVAENLPDDTQDLGA